MLKFAIAGEAAAPSTPPPFPWSMERMACRRPAIDRNGELQKTNCLGLQAIDCNGLMGRRRADWTGSAGDLESTGLERLVGTEKIFNDADEDRLHGCRFV